MFEGTVSEYNLPQIDQWTRGQQTDGTQSTEEVNQRRAKYGLPPLAPTERETLISDLTGAAKQMMGGPNIPTAQSLYNPQIASLRQNAVNLAGSNAADLARRGMAYSGAADKAVRDAGTQLAADTANAKTQATSRVQGWQRDAYNQGLDFLKTAEDQNVSNELLRESKKRATEINNQAWSDSGSIF